MSSATCSRSAGCRRGMTNSHPTRGVSRVSSYDRSHKSYKPSRSSGTICVRRSITIQTSLRSQLTSRDSPTRQKMVTASVAREPDAYLNVFHHRSENPL